MLSLVKSHFFDTSQQRYTEIIDLRRGCPFFIFVPDEIIYKIFQDLNVSTLINLNLTNRKFYKITNSDDFWKPHVLKLHLQHSKKTNDLYKKTFSSHCVRLKKAASKETYIEFVKEARANLKTIDDIANLSKTLSSKDKLILWEHLAINIGEEAQIFTKKTDVNKSKEFGNWIADNTLYLDQIVSMNFSHHQLSSVPIELCLFQSLTSLNLSKNHIEKFPRKIGLLTNLTSLNLSKNNIKRLPTSIIMLEKLKKLELSNNELRSISKISFFSNLKKLNLSNNHLQGLSLSLNSCTNLKKLTIANNALTELPICLSSFSSLKKLTISENQLSMPLKEMSQHLKISLRIEKNETILQSIFQEIKI